MKALRGDQPSQVRLTTSPARYGNTGSLCSGFLPDATCQSPSQTMPLHSGREAPIGRRALLEASVTLWATTQSTNQCPPYPRVRIKQIKGRYFRRLKYWRTSLEASIIPSTLLEVNDKLVKVHGVFSSHHE